MNRLKMEELLRLPRENIALLKQLLAYIANRDNGSSVRDFMINYFANKAADIY